MVHAVRYSGHGGSGTPMNDWTPNDPDTFDVAKIEAYSNCEEVELFLNDKSLGSKPVSRDRRPVVWDNVSYEAGVLKAVGRIAGRIVATHEMRTAGEPAQIVLTADRTNTANEFDDVSQVIATIVDANGVVCPNQENLLSFKLAGPGRIVALSTGDRMSHQPFQAGERKAFRGQCLAIVRATASSGKIELTASAEGLAGGTITLEAVASAAR
jgi:beta-galactosidase